MKEIYKRRSIRKFTDKKIEDEKLKKILKAGLNAPSAGNQQPWEFVAVRDKELLNKLSELSPYAGMLKQSDVAIVVCGNLENARFDAFWVQDCSASTQNMLLEATSLDIGSVWLGVYPNIEGENFVRSVLNIPEEIHVFCVVALGYPDEEKEINDKFDEHKIKYDMYK